MQIRPYQDSDFELLTSWWTAADVAPPPRGAIPIESTWVVIRDHEPIVSACLLLTNIKAFAYIENLISNPAAHAEDRHQAVELMVRYIENHARRLGYGALACYGRHDQLVRRYQGLGYQPAERNLTALVKGL